VSHLLQDFDFPRYALDVFFVPNASLFKYFNCYVLARQHVLGHFDFSERSLTQALSENVMTKFGAGRVLVKLLLFIFLLLFFGLFETRRHWLRVLPC
jgi:hypothetical protein